MKRNTIVKKQPERKRPAPKALEQDVGYMAERVIAGDLVYADLNDGSFEALMAELRRRGWVLAPRGVDDPDRQANPFLFRVKRDEPSPQPSPYPAKSGGAFGGEGEALANLNPIR